MKFPKLLIVLLGFLAVSVTVWACKGDCPPCPACPPVAEQRLTELRAEPVVVDQGCNCFTFDGSKSSDADGDALSYEWDLGDGTKATDPIVQHCYQKAGNYTVSLIVRDGNGICGTGATSVNVVAEFPPIANAGDDMTICIEKPAQFDGSKSTAGSDAVASWDYGDGATGAGMATSHTYTAPGTYVATLSLSNANGGCGSSTDTVVVTVKTKPVSVVEVS